MSLDLKKLENIDLTCLHLTFLLLLQSDMPRRVGALKDKVSVDEVRRSLFQLLLMTFHMSEPSICQSSRAGTEVVWAVVGLFVILNDG